MSKNKSFNRRKYSSSRRSLSSSALSSSKGPAFGKHSGSEGSARSASQSLSLDQAASTTRTGSDNEAEADVISLSNGSDHSDVGNPSHIASMSSAFSRWKEQRIATLEPGDANTRKMIESLSNIPRLLSDRKKSLNLAIQETNKGLKHTTVTDTVTQGATRQYSVKSKGKRRVAASSIFKVASITVLPCGIKKVNTSAPLDDSDDEELLVESVNVLPSGKTSVPGLAEVRILRSQLLSIKDENGIDIDKSWDFEQLTQALSKHLPVLFQYLLQDQLEYTDNEESKRSLFPYKAPFVLLHKIRSKLEVLPRTPYPTGEDVGKVAISPRIHFQESKLFLATWLPIPRQILVSWEKGDYVMSVPVQSTSKQHVISQTHRTSTKRKRALPSPSPSSDEYRDSADDDDGTAKPAPKRTRLTRSMAVDDEKKDESSSTGTDQEVTAVNNSEEAMDITEDGIDSYSEEAMDVTEDGIDSYSVDDHVSWLQSQAEYNEMVNNDLQLLHSPDPTRPSTPVVYNLDTSFASSLSLDNPWAADREFRID